MILFLSNIQYFLNSFVFIHSTWKKMLNSFVGLWVFSSALWLDDLFYNGCKHWFVRNAHSCIRNIYHMQWTFFRMLILHSSRMKKLFPFECFHQFERRKNPSNKYVGAIWLVMSIFSSQAINHAFRRNKITR